MWTQLDQINDEQQCVIVVTATLLALIIDANLIIKNANWMYTLEPRILCDKNLIDLTSRPEITNGFSCLLPHVN